MPLHVSVIVVWRSIAPASPTIDSVPRLQVLLKLSGPVLASRIDVRIHSVYDGVGERRVNVIGTLELGVHEDLRGIEIVAGFHEETGRAGREVVIEVCGEEAAKRFDVVEEGGDGIGRVGGPVVEGYIEGDVTSKMLERKLFGENRKLLTYLLPVSTSSTVGGQVGQPLLYRETLALTGL